jgi:hypothetical protein
VSFKRELTSENKAVFLNLIYATCKDMVHNITVASVVSVIVWVFEFYCAYWFIDTDKSVSLKAAINKPTIPRSDKIDSESLKMLWNLYDIRNNVVHSPYMLLKDDRLVGILETLKFIKKSDLDEICTVFEDNADYVKSCLFIAVTNLHRLMMQNDSSATNSMNCF